MSILTAHAAHTTVTRMSATEYGINDENTGRKVAHVSVIRGFGYVTGVRGSAFADLTAVVRLGGANMMDAVQEALIEGLRNGRDDRRSRA